MGLDMWIFSAKKVDESRLPEVPHADDLDVTDLHYIVKEDIEGEEELIEELRPFFIERKGIAKYTDWDMLRKAFDIPDGAYPGGYSFNGAEWEFRFYDNGKSYPVKISDEEFEKCRKEHEVEFIIYDLKEITYFRKDYELENSIYEVYNKYTGKDIENCGYYRLTKDMIKELNERDKSFRMLKLSEDDDTLYYHEWY